MEFFNRIKTILLNPKEEWEIIEAENEPHEKVLPYLLVIALIPAAALFFNYWWHWNSSVSAAIQKVTDAAALNSSGYMQERLQESIMRIKESMPFNATIGIIPAVTSFAVILLGVYVSALIINALSNQFGVEKNLNRTFSLVVYSYTPLCIAGLLYAFPSFSSLVPYIGLYGLYLLYTGIKPRINPPAEKFTGYLIMTLVVSVAAYLVIPKVIQPITNDIQKNILIEQAKKRSKVNGHEIDFRAFQQEIER